MVEASVGGCPAEDVIAAFVADDLDAAERESLEQHMDRCAPCRSVVAEMVRVFAGSRVPTVSPDGSITPDDEARDPDQVPIGASIGRYRVVDVVGMGGMGIVYAAEDPELERRVAVKVLHSRGGSDAKAQSERLLREARAMAKLSHPNVIAVHDVGTWNGRVFVAMELVEGWTLRRWLEEHPRTWASVWPVLHAAGRGLAAAHEAGFVHRDFKPDNVLVGASGRVFVTDFGLARWAEATTAEMLVTEASVGADTRSIDARTEPERFSALTRSGAFVGTPAYMAPEQFARAQVGAASDQFAFCVVVWEALFGSRPFEGRTVAALAAAVCEADPPPFPTYTHVPRHVKAALLRGLAKSPADRHPSMAALLRAMEPRRRAWLPWVAAGTVAAASMGAALFVTHDDDASAAAACDDLPGLRDAWDDARRASIHDAFARTEARYAASASANVIARLDAYAAAWASRETEVCEAGGDPARIALRLDCLDRSRIVFTNIVAGLEDADANLVDRAVRVVAGLPDLAACVDDARLTAEMPPVPPSELSSEVEAVRDALIAADADLQLGRFAAGLERVDAVVDRANALAFQPLVAEVAYARGRMLSNIGRYEEAAEELERAELEATASRHVQVAAKAAIMRLYATGRVGADWPTLESLVKRAEASVQAARLSDAEHSTLYINAAVAAFYAGEVETAEALSHRALELLDRQKDPLRWASASLNLAGYQRRRGAEETSLPVLRAVIEVYEEQLGRVHPDVGEAYRELAVALKNLERFDDARTAAKTSLEIIAEAMGEDHYSYGGVLSTLSGIEGMAGRTEEALRLAKRSSAVLGLAGKSTLIPDSQQAEWLIALGRPDEARPIVDRLLAEEEKARGEGHPSTAWIWFVRCWLEAARKDVDATRAACDRAIALTGAEAGSEEELSLQLDRAVHMWNAGAGAEALQPLLELLPRVEAAAVSPTTARIYRELGERSWELVRDAQGREKARAWMEKAHAQMVEMEMVRTAAEVRKWLDEHGS